MSTEFRIDVLDSTGVRVDEGPLTTVLALEDTARLDAIGSAQFTLPAEDPRGANINAGALFDIYDRVDGYLGRFYYRSKTIDAKAAGGAQLVVACHNQLIELARKSVYFRRTYVAQAVDDVIQDLAALVAGWSDVTDAGIGSTSVSYEGESVLLAVDVLRDRWNKHFRLGEARVLEFGAFGADSGLTLTNVRGQVQGEIALNTNIALVETIRLVDESDEVFNYIIPLGAGQGTAQLTIEQATLGTYTVETGTNDDGSHYYFIQDATSVAAYGRREKILSFPSIRPITNSDANILNAANALKLTAEAYLARHLVPKVTYAIAVRGLRENVSVGDLVRLQYRGVVDGYSFIDVNADFYVMDVTRKRDVNGTRTATLVIAAVADRRTSDTDVMMDVVSDIRALKVSVPLSLARTAHGPYVLRLSLSHTAEFTVRIGSEVLFLNYAILRFRTSPLKSSVTAAASGGGSAPTSGASSAATTSSGGASTSGADTSHTHTVTVAAHTHNVTTNNHTHTIPIKDDGTGSAVRYNATNHWFTCSTGLGSDSVATSSSGGGETVSSASGGSSSPTSSGGSSHTHSTPNHSHNMPHTHDVTIAAHSHDLIYGVYEDTEYPTDITVTVNGDGSYITDTTTPESHEIEIDITADLNDAVGGLRQNHRILFECASGQGEVECEVDILCTIQAIAVS